MVSDRTFQIIALAVSGWVASVLLVVLFTFCGIAIYRRFFRRTDGKPKKERKIYVETSKKTDTIVVSSNGQSRPGSVLTTDGSTTAFWSRQENRRRRTEEKTRRLNIADNFEGDSDGNILVPPPPIRRGVASDTPERSGGSVVSESAAAVSSLGQGDVEHKSAFNSITPSDNLEPTPGTSTESTPALPPLVIKKLNTSDDSQSFVSSAKQAEDRGDDEEPVTPTTATQTPKIENFTAPDEDGFYKLRVG